MTKKILFWILTFLWIWLSFCSAFDFDISKLSSISVYSWDITSIPDIAHFSLTPWLYCIAYGSLWFDWSNLRLTFSPEYLITESATYYQYIVRNVNNNLNTFYCFDISSNTDVSLYPNSYSITWQYYIFPFNDYFLNSSSSSINVFYNWFNDVESFTCDWDTSIYLDWNYNYTSSNSLFSPYINIHYTDSDNQVLTWEYEKTDLFLDWQYNKLYTWGSNNFWFLTPIESPDLNIISYQPTFDVEFTWDIVDTWNIFNNFAENSLKFTLSNVPNYIQYVIIIMLLFFILWFIRKFRRK